MLVGRTETANTHLAIAAARSCIRTGARGRLYNVVDLVNRLETETRNGRQGRFADHLTRSDFIILDELGYLPFPQSGGQLLFHLVCRALMGLTALLGVFAAGALSDRLGPAWPTAASFVARILAFGLLMIDQSAASIAIFALVFGATFLVTAPLTVLFVSDNFGTRHLGSLTGLITLVHHVSGAVGAYLGSTVFDSTGSYDVVFPIMLGSSVFALLLTWPLMNHLGPNERLSVT